MSTTIDPRQARIAVYAVSIGFELGLDSRNLDSIRRLAEARPLRDSKTDPTHQSIVDLASQYSDWDDRRELQETEQAWPTPEAADFTPQLLEALLRVRHLIQPMNRI